MSANPGTAVDSIKRQGFGDNRRSFRRKNQSNLNPNSNPTTSTNNNRTRQFNSNNATNNGSLSSNSNRKHQNNANPQSNQTNPTKRIPKNRPPKSSNSSKKTLNNDTTNKNGASREASVGIEFLSEHEEAVKEKVVIPSQQPAKLQSYSNEEKSLTGGVFANPESYGFVRKSMNAVLARPVPAYLLPHPRLLVTPVFHQNEWDKTNQEKMLQLEASNTGNDYQGIYEEFQKMREVERLKMEELGLVDAEHIAKDLNDAIAFQGSCLDMCPTFERVRRALENNVKSFEKDPQTNRISRSRAVKAFSRPAAGQPPPLPSDVRPPHVLKNTLDYLVDNALQQLPASHSFLWDRTRSIRQDFTYQNFFGPEAIDCNERIVRIHLISLHIMAGSDVEYSQQQELEQFNKALQTLIEIYDDIRNHGGKAPNEAEFRAYYLLSHLRDPELEREIQSLPNDIMLDSNVQLALYFRSIVAQNNIVERGYINTPGASNLFYDFFKVVYSERTPLLLACLMETHFNEIRFYALKSMTRSYHSKSKKYPAHQLKDLLGFDTVENLVKFVSYYDVDVVYENGVQGVDLFNQEKLKSKYKLNSIGEKARMAQPYSPQLDTKIAGRPMSFFINSGHLNSHLGLKEALTRPILATKIGAIAKLTHSIQNTPASGFGSTPSGGFGSVPSGGFGSKPSSGFGAVPVPSALLFTKKNENSQITNAQGSMPFGLATIPGSTESSKSTSSKFLLGETIIPQPSQPRSKLSTIAPTSLFSKLDKTSVLAPTSQQSIILQSAKIAEISRKDLAILEPLVKPPQSNMSLASLSLSSARLKSTDFNPVSLDIKSSRGHETLLATSSTKSSKVVNNPRFKESASLLLDELIENGVNELLSELVPRVIAYENRSRERKLIIDALSSELLSAFVSEITYEQSLTSLADFYYYTHTRIRTIKKLISIGQKLQTKHEFQRKKLNELSTVSFRGTFAKPTRSFSASSSANSSLASISSALSGNHRKRQRVMSKNDIGTRKRVIRDLWDPLDLEIFLQECSHNVKLGIERHVIDIKFLLVVEDWSTPYSKWLKNKLSLKPNATKNIYENSLSDGKIRVNILSLPGRDLLTNEFFMDTGFLLFECGIVVQNESSDISIHNKLEHDKKVLVKLIQFISQFGYYKVQIIILYWNNSDVKLASDEVKGILNLDGFSEDIIKRVIFCDMAKPNGNVNIELSEAFSIVSSNFRGELTPRGIKKRQKIKHANTPGTSETSTPLPSVDGSTKPDRFKEREEQALKVAKSARKYGYLQSYARRNRDDSFNHSINRTSNNTTTFMNLLNSRYNISTSVMNALGVSNASILNGLGNRIALESTPATSPKPTRVDDETQFVKPAAPKQIQLLQSLTAGILAKYRKK